MVDAAINGPHSVPSVVMNIWMPIWMTLFSGVRESSSGQKYSFQVEMKTRMLNEASVPRRLGAMTCHRMRQWPAPSMRAASMTPRGEARTVWGSSMMGEAGARGGRDDLPQDAPVARAIHACGLNDLAREGPHRLSEQHDGEGRRQV